MFTTYKPFIVSGDIIKFIKDIPKHSNYLDIGCVKGFNLLIRKDIKSFGCIADNNSVRECLLNNLKVSFADYRNLPYDSKVFDAITCTSVFYENIDDRILFISEMIRVCKHKGRIFIYFSKILNYNNDNYNINNLINDVNKAGNVNILKIYNDMDKMGVIIEVI